jgi:predicted dienelactone hydrolase
MRSARGSATPHYRTRRTVAGLLTTAVLATIAVVVSALPGGMSRRDVRHRRAPVTRTSAARLRASRAQPRPRPQPARPRHVSTRAPVAPYRVGTEQIKLIEPAGGARTNATTASGRPVRALPTVIRYPALGAAGAGDHPGARPSTAGGPFPLIVFSEGYNVSAEVYSALLDAWARAGYVVADPTYPFNDPSTPGGPQESDIVNHPADLRFVISSLLAANQDPGSPLHRLMRTPAVAVIGHSDGGDVTLAVAANTCCRDRRVKAAVILSGAELGAFGGSYYGAGSVPLLVIQGTADTVNLPGCSAALYDQAPAPKYYIGLPGAQHQPPYLDPGRTRSHVAQAVIDFLNRYLKHEPSGLPGLRRAATLAAVASITSAPTLPGAGTYCP